MAAMWLRWSELQRDRRRDLVDCQSLVRRSRRTPTRPRHGDEPNRFCRLNVGRDGDGRFGKRATPAAASAASAASSPCSHGAVRDVSSHDQRDRATRSDAQRSKRLLDWNDAQEQSISEATLRVGRGD